MCKDCRNWVQLTEKRLDYHYNLAKSGYQGRLSCRSVRHKWLSHLRLSASICGSLFAKQFIDAEIMAHELNKVSKINVYLRSCCDFQRKASKECKAIPSFDAGVMRRGSLFPKQSLMLK